MGFLGRHLQIALETAGHTVRRGVHRQARRADEIAVDYARDVDAGGWRGAAHRGRCGDQRGRDPAGGSRAAFRCHPRPGAGRSSPPAARRACAASSLGARSGCRCRESIPPEQAGGGRLPRHAKPRMGHRATGLRVWARRGASSAPCSAASAPPVSSPRTACVRFDDGTRAGAGVLIATRGAGLRGSGVLDAQGLSHHDLPHRQRSGSRARAPASGGCTAASRAGQKVLSLQTVPTQKRRLPLGAVSTGRALASMPRCAAPPIRGRNSNACATTSPAPPSTNERLALNRAGQVVLTLKTPYREARPIS